MNPSTNLSINILVMSMNISISILGLYINLRIRNLVILVNPYGGKSNELFHMRYYILRLIPVTNYLGIILWLNWVQGRLSQSLLISL